MRGFALHPKDVLRTKMGFHHSIIAVRILTGFSGYPQMVRTMRRRTFHKQHATHNLENTILTTQHTTCNTQYAIHHMEHTMCHTQHAVHVIHNMQYTTCSMEKTTYKEESPLHPL